MRRVSTTAFLFGATATVALLAHVVTADDAADDKYSDVHQACHTDSAGTHYTISFDPAKGNTLLKKSAAGEVTTKVYAAAAGGPGEAWAEGVLFANFMVAQDVFPTHLEVDSASWANDGATRVDTLTFRAQGGVTVAFSSTECQAWYNCKPLGSPFGPHCWTEYESCCGWGSTNAHCIDKSTDGKCCSWLEGAATCGPTDVCCGQKSGAEASAFCCSEGSTCCRATEGLTGTATCCAAGTSCCRLDDAGLCCQADEYCDLVNRRCSKGTAPPTTAAPALPKQCWWGTTSLMCTTNDDCCGSMEAGPFCCPHRGTCCPIHATSSSDPSSRCCPEGTTCCHFPFGGECCNTTTHRCDYDYVVCRPLAAPTTTAAPQPTTVAPAPTTQAPTTQAPTTQTPTTTAIPTAAPTTTTRPPTDAPTTPSDPTQAPATSAPAPVGSTWNCPGPVGTAYGVNCDASTEQCCGAGTLTPHCNPKASTDQCCQWSTGSATCRARQQCCGDGVGADSRAFCCDEGSFCCPAGSATAKHGASCCPDGALCCGTPTGSFCCDRATQQCDVLNKRCAPLAPSARTLNTVPSAPSAPVSPKSSMAPNVDVDGDPSSAAGASALLVAAAAAAVALGL